MLVPKHPAFNIKKLSLFIVCILLTTYTYSQNLKVAVAANLQAVIKVLDADFKAKTGIVVEPIVGASGNLVNQIKNGAPFDLFLSADIGFADLLYNDGFSTDKPVVYATGSLIICSTQPLDLKNWQTTILRPDIKKIALGNPNIAPYGQAAKEAMTSLSIYDNVTAKLVTAESITQVNTYITTKVVSVGFTAQSFVYDGGQHDKLFWQVIDQKLYTPIQQGMVVLKHGKDTNAANADKFFKYLLSAPAKTIFKKYGYQTT